MKVSLIGAGGHARSLINILEQLNIEIKGVYDDQYQDSMQGELIAGYPLLGGLDQIDPKESLIISKGECALLEKYRRQFANQLLKSNVIHPKALVESEQIGEANQISALSYISKSASIGNNNIIYSNSTLEHEVQMGDCNVITVNVAICGRVKIGNRCFIGASATLLPKVKICDDVIIGAGAVVTKDITSPGTYVGTPAKRMQSV